MPNFSTPDISECMMDIVMFRSTSIVIKVIAAHFLSFFFQVTFPYFDCKFDWLKHTDEKKV